MKAKKPKKPKGDPKARAPVPKAESENHAGALPEKRGAGGEKSPPRGGLGMALDFQARGEPLIWLMGGALALGVLMIAGFLALVLWNGIVTFYPGPVRVLTLKSGERIAGEPFRSERFRPSPEQWKGLDAPSRRAVRAAD